MPSILSSGVTQINILIGTIIASFETGAVSYLYYADRIYQINLAIAGIAVGTVSLPALSNAFKNKNLKKLSSIQSKSFELSLLLSIPASFGLILASEEIVNSLFGYGSFSKEDVQSTAVALKYFGYGVPAFALVKVLSNFFFARDNTKTPFYISLICVVLNVVISLYYFKNIGFIIIPIATTISSWINSILLFIFLYQRNLFRFNGIFFIKFFKIFFASIFMGVLFKYLIIIFEYQLVYSFHFKSIYLIISVFICVIFYLLFSLFINAFKYEDINLKY